MDILVRVRGWKPFRSQILTDMRSRLLRPLLIVEFLIAIQAVFTLWSQVGGQFHLDLMFWPWKFGLGIGAAVLIVAITANIAQNSGALTRRALLLGSLLLATVAVAGVVTYYYHVNEPTDESDETDEPAKISRFLLPDPAGVSATYHR
jgi:hypothetical protein